MPNLSRPETGKTPKRAPDSWYATYENRLNQLLSTAGSDDTEYARSIREAIVFEDDRQEIQNKNIDPYTWVCQLDIEDARGGEWSGTGWFAAPGLIITAGHCVYLHNRGGWARNILITVNENNTKSTQTMRGVDFHTVDGWINGADESYDYGAITVRRENGREQGYFGYSVLDDADLTGELVNVAGYPTDKPKGTLWGSVKILQNNTQETLIYDLDTYFGMSGSPVILWDKSDYFAIGIHNYGDISGNRATRMTESVFQTIQGWARLTQGI